MSSCHRGDYHKAVITACSQRQKNNKFGQQETIEQKSVPASQEELRHLPDDMSCKAQKSNGLIIKTALRG